MYKKAGDSMKKVITISRVHLQSWKLNCTIWAGLCIGLALCQMYVLRFTSYCNVIGTACQIVEPYIIMGNMSKHSFTGIFLGCIVVLSDAPFINKQSTYEIIRVGTCTWLRAQILYIIIVTLIYNFYIMLTCTALGVIRSNVFYENRWSTAISLLAVQQPAFAVANFKLNFPYANFIYTLRPYNGALLTLLFNAAYCIIAILLIFIVNIWTQTNMGWIAGAAFHIWGYVVSNNGGLLFKFNISTLECALPAVFLSEDSPVGPFWAAWLLAVLILLLIDIAQKSHRRLVL